MTKHIDRYGRTWNYTPDHDTGRMLQIDPAIMLVAYNFHNTMRTQEVGFCGAHTGGWPVDPVDCYLLKMQDEWCVGIRLSDEPSDYISPYFDRRVIEFMIECHGTKVRKYEGEAFYILTTKLTGWRK